MRAQKSTRTCQPGGRLVCFSNCFSTCCLSSPIQDSCGEWVTALCPYGESGCPDNEGDYDIVMPEPMTGTSGSGYKVRVMDVSDEGEMDCSDSFTLVASEEAPFSSEDYSLTVTSPAAGDMAKAGEEYTVEVSTRSCFCLQGQELRVTRCTSSANNTC